MDPRIPHSHSRPTTTFPSPVAPTAVTIAHATGPIPAPLPADASAISSDGYNTALVTELLRHKRKARDVKSCFPCRRRKVRCDGGLPCSNCVKRDHVSLCRRVTTAPGTSSVTKATVAKGISSVQSNPSVAASSPRSVVGEPYGGGNGFVGAFDPATQHNGYIDHSSPSTVANHDVGMNGMCVAVLPFFVWCALADSAGDC